MKLESHTFGLILAVVLLSAFPAHATDYYVSQSQGNNSYSGTSSQQPWQTIGKVNSASLKSGDKVYFKRGDTWTDAQLLGRTDVTYDAFDTGVLPHINRTGSVGDKSPAFYGMGTSGTKVYRLKLTSGSETGQYAAVVMGRGIEEVSYCEIKNNAPSYGGYVSGVYQGSCAKITNCNIDVPFGLGISGQSLDNVYFAGNHIKSGDMPIKIGDSRLCNGAVVENNYIEFYNNNIGGQWGVTAKAIQNYIVRNNIIDITNSDADLNGAIHYLTGAYGSSNGKWYNNTIIGNGSKIGVTCPSGTLDVYFKNNLFYNLAVAFDISGASALKNNAFYNCKKNYTIGSGTNDIKLTADPFMKSGNKPAPYWSLNSTSGGGALCIDKGVNDDPDIPTKDYLGNARVAIIDIAALEYNSSSPPLSAPTNLRLSQN